jgi:hypothetical protein
VPVVLDGTLDLKTATCSAQKTFKECSCLLLSHTAHKHCELANYKYQIKNNWSAPRDAIGLTCGVNYFLFCKLCARDSGLLKCLFAHTERGLEKKIIIRERRAKIH